MKALTPAQLAAATLSLQGCSQKEIADRLGVSPRSIASWLQLPQSQAIFLDFADSCRKKLLAQQDRLQSLAFDAIEEIVSDRDQSPSARLTAARLILSARDCGCKKSESQDPLRDELIRAYAANHATDFQWAIDRYGYYEFAGILDRMVNASRSAAVAAMADEYDHAIAAAAPPPQPPPAAPPQQ